MFTAYCLIIDIVQGAKVGTITIDRLRSGLKVYCFGVVESKKLSMQSQKFLIVLLPLRDSGAHAPMPEFFRFFKIFNFALEDFCP